MHNCTCCHSCQQELALLRAQHQSLLLDYPPLKQKAILARQTLQIYKDENVQLNKSRIDLQARVAYLEQQLSQSQLEHHQENPEARRESRRLDELNRVIIAKNSQIAALKQELHLKAFEMENLRKKSQELDATNAAIISRVRVLENITKNMIITTTPPQQEKVRTINDPLSPQKI